MSASPPASLIAAAQVGGVQAAGVEIATFHVKYINVQTPMRDGVKLVGDLYLPAINGVPDDSQSGMRGTRTRMYKILGRAQPSLALISPPCLPLALSAQAASIPAC